MNVVIGDDGVADGDPLARDLQHVMEYLLVVLREWVYREENMSAFEKQGP